MFPRLLRHFLRQNQLPEHLDIIDLSPFPELLLQAFRYQKSILLISRQKLPLRSDVCEDLLRTGRQLLVGAGLLLLLQFGLPDLVVEEEWFFRLPIIFGILLARFLLNNFLLG